MRTLNHKPDRDTTVGSLGRQTSPIDPPIQICDLPQNLPEEPQVMPVPPRVLTIAGSDSGGGAGAQAVDLLFDGHVARRLTARRHDTPNTHGTGCTLASAIASNLAWGLDVPA